MHTAAGGRVEDAYWRKTSEAGSEREGEPCGSVRGGRGARCQERPGPRHPQSALLTVAALRCLAWGLLCKTHSSVRRGQVFLVSLGTDSGTHLVLNEYLMTDE